MTADAGLGLVVKMSGDGVEDAGPDPPARSAAQRAGPQSCRRWATQVAGSGMQHAEHFLTRLDRLPGCEVDLALELYRDPDLLRAVLDAATLPERVERVAISIDDPVLGPFLIVTRTGQFVTCLGRGMRSGDLPVVTRGDLDAISRKITRLREKMALAEKLDAPRRDDGRPRAIPVAHRAAPRIARGVQLPAHGDRRGHVHPERSMGCRAPRHPAESRLQRLHAAGRSTVPTRCGTIRRQNLL